MTNTNAWRNPSEDYPPSRPGLKIFLALGGLILLTLAIAFWPAISTFAHFPQITAALGV
jgi:hypothetical protein